MTSNVAATALTILDNLKCTYDGLLGRTHSISACDHHLPRFHALTPYKLLHCDKKNKLLVDSHYSSRSVIYCYPRKTHTSTFSVNTNHATEYYGLLPIVQVILNMEIDTVPYIPSKLGILK